MIRSDTCSRCSDTDDMADDTTLPRNKPMPISRTLAVTFSAIALAALSHAASAAEQPVIGLITKTETNPFFVKMKEGATAAAKKLGAKLVSAAGKTDGDNAGQVTAMENLIAAGAKTILITPSDAKAIVPAIKKEQAPA